MKTIHPELEAHLLGGATTLCTCWILQRRDGVVQGFTDHDRTLVVEGIACEGISGFASTEAVSEAGLSVDGLDVEGVLSSPVLAEADIKAGLYDEATIDIYLVNWQQPDQFLHQRTALLGEITLEDSVFKAELRGLTSMLDKRSGRTFARHCDASLGDHRCRVDLDQARLRVTGTVGAVGQGADFFSTALGDHEAGWFAGGTLTWISGANAGVVQEVSASSADRGGQVLLFESPAQAMEPGDEFSLTAGCDKSFRTCRAKFANARHFQGFPHMPGSDFSMNYARSGAVHDGSALIK